MTPDRSWPYEVLCWAWLAVTIVWFWLRPAATSRGTKRLMLALPMFVLSMLITVWEGQARLAFLIVSGVVGFALVLLLASRIWPEKIHRRS